METGRDLSPADEAVLLRHYGADPDLRSATVPEPGAPDELHELILHEEQLVMETRVVPVERVRMRKVTVTEQQTVSEDGST